MSLPKMCSVAECERTHYAKGLCEPHYQRSRKGAPIDGTIREKVGCYDGASCSVDGCSGNAEVKGLCKTHYSRTLRCIPLDFAIVPIERYADDAKCSADGCENRPKARGLCEFHYKRLRGGVDLNAPPKGPPKYGPGRHMNSDGYVVIDVPADTLGAQISTGRTRMLEHRYVVQKALGRQLLPTQTVHHKNGIRHDNRIENLELKAGAHGRGITVPDAVVNSLDLLERYAGLDIYERAVLIAIRDKAEMGLLGDLCPEKPSKLVGHNKINKAA